MTPRTAAGLVRTSRGAHQKAARAARLAAREEEPQGPGRPAGYLVDAIRKDAPPPGFESRAEKDTRRRGQAGTGAARGRGRPQEARAKAAEQEQKARIDGYLKGLSPAELANLDQVAIAQASPERRAAIKHAPEGPIRRSQLRLLREAHVRRVLELPELASD